MKIYYLFLLNMREYLDKYYTKKEIANKCCSIFSKKIKIDHDNDIVIEPSAGNGSFIKPLKKMCKKRLFIDISPEHKEVQQCDFLKVAKEDICKNKNINKIHVLGNPPFGFKSSTAIAFIKHACTFCDTFCFILPKSFNKSSMKKTVPLNFHLIYSYNLPENSFLKSNEPYNVNCVCQIWKKQNTLRKILPKENPKFYSFTNNPSKATIAIRRVGYNTGRIFTDDLQRKNKNSHYFIKLDDEEDKKLLSNINLKSSNDVTGPKSLSKHDIILSLNKMISKKPK